MTKIRTIGRAEAHRRFRFRLRNALQDIPYIVLLCKHFFAKKRRNRQKDYCFFINFAIFTHKNRNIYFTNYGFCGIMKMANQTKAISQERNQRI